MSICVVFKLQLCEASDCSRRRNMQLGHMRGSVGTDHATSPSLDVQCLMISILIFMLILSRLIPIFFL